MVKLIPVKRSLVILIGIAIGLIFPQILFKELYQQPKSEQSKKNTIFIDRYVCINKSEHAKYALPEDVDWEDMKMAPPPFLPSTTASEKAEMIHQSLYCADKYGLQNLDVIPVSRTTRASDKDNQKKEEMKELDRRINHIDSYTCIRTSNCIYTAELRECSSDVLISGFSDNPAPRGNLPVTHGNRCKEGYTEHANVLQQIIPDGYHYDIKGEPKPMPTLDND